MIKLMCGSIGFTNTWQWFERGRKGLTPAAGCDMFGSYIWLPADEQMAMAIAISICNIIIVYI